MQLQTKPSAHTFSSHLATSGTFNLRLASVRSLTKSGNIAMKFPNSSLLTSTPVITEVTGGEQSMLIDLKNRTNSFLNIVGRYQPNVL